MTISSLPGSPVDEYDLDNKNYDDLPVAPQETFSSDVERDDFMWKSLCREYEGTEAGKYFNKVSEMMKNY
jgi:hypothetical protein